VKTQLSAKELRFLAHRNDTKGNLDSVDCGALIETVYALREALDEIRYKTRTRDATGDPYGALERIAEMAFDAANPLEPEESSRC
jgi:hypothetical protein